jgi:hypothetical protein
LAKDGVPHGRSDETFVQLHGTGNRTDLLPGLIFSDLEHDLCTCSEAALGVIIDVLERPLQTVLSPAPGAQAVSVGQRRAFDQLRAEFLAGMQMPMQPLECKLLKLADSFNTPPAREWASLEVGGCAERNLTLSRLNDMQEIAQIRGPATDWFCEVAERAGNALPACIPDSPILFDDIQRGFGGPRPVMNREPLERWVGFVFATLKRYGHEALRVWWGTNLGPLSYGLATINRDLFAASVLAIDLAGLTTAAEETANRERASCSPFSVPSMEEQGFQWAEETPPPLSPPDNYTLGRLVDDLRRFGEQYHQSVENIRQENPVVQRHSRIQLGAFVSQSRAFLQIVPGFNELRTLAQSLWREEISFAVGQRIVDALVQGSNGSLSAVAVEGLTLAEAASRLTPAHEGGELPASTDGDARQQNQRRPGDVEKSTIPAPVERTTSIDEATVSLPQARRTLKEPSKDAFSVYRFWFASSCVLSDRKTQRQLAEDPELMNHLGRKVDQGTISRWLNQVRDWIKAGNILPDLSDPLETNPTPMDPERIDLGPHREHRPKHQRKRRTSDSEE